MRLSRVLSIGCAGLAALAGCAGSDPAEPDTIYTLSIRSGDAQSGPAGSLLEEPLQVTVRDAGNTPVKGVSVRFRVTTRAGAALTDTLAVTGTDGVARTLLRVGQENDTAVVQAAVPRQEERGVTFRAVATAGAALAALAPNRFAPGDTITVRGARFNVSAAGNAVYFGAARGRVIAASGDSVLRVVVPPCLASGGVQLRVQVGSAQTNALTGTVAGIGAPLRLAAFEAVTVSGTEEGSCLVLAGGSRYLLVPQFASVGDTSPASRIFALGVDSVLTTPRALADAAGVGPVAVRRPGGARAELERFLRGEERRIAREAAVRGPGPRPALSRTGTASQAQPADPPPLGSTRSFRVLSKLDGTAFATASARLRYVGQNILVYEDQATPEPFAESVLKGLGDHIDRTLYPLDVATFGAESDIDNNGRVIVLLTPVVNGLTEAGRCQIDGFSPGFFYGIDLETRDRNSNRAELFYAFVPDPRAERSCAHTVEEVLRLLPPIFLHEFQHMISFNQHVLVRRGSEEDVWLNEGLSHVAEELGAQYYDQRYPAPSGRASPTQMLPDSAVNFIRPNLDNAALFMGNPGLSSVTTFADFGTLEERGAAWLFLRWLAAQKGEGIYSRLVQTSRTSRRNVEEASGETFAGLFADFGIALYADSVPGIARSRIPSRYRFAGKSLREHFTRLTTRGTRYPLTVRTAPAVGGTAPGAMVQGSFDFFDLTVSRPAGVAIRFGAPGGGAFPASAEAQIGVLRLTP